MDRAAVTAAAVTGLLTMAVPTGALPAESICYGTTANGRLEHGVELPVSGPNFQAYGRLPVLLGRTYVHSTVRDVVVSAYEALEAGQPDKRFVYAETGFAEGGEFAPHKTHRNGLSVDFMVPVLDAEGRSVPLPTSVFNRWGYDLEFDERGRHGDLRIDFEALAAHLAALDRAARAHGVGVWRVIFDPVLQPFVLDTDSGAYVSARMRLSTRRSWVRHDEHYHVDFDVPCRDP